MDVLEESILGFSQLEIGDRIETYRTTLVDGKRLLRENGQLVDPVEYPVLESITDLRYSSNAANVTGESSALSKYGALDVTAKMLYYARINGDLYAYDIDNSSTSVIYNPGGNTLTSPFITPDGTKIACVDHVNSSNSVTFHHSADSAASFQFQALNIGWAPTSMAFTCTDDLAKQFFVAASTANDYISIGKRENTGTPTVEKTVAITNPVLDDNYVTCNGDGSLLFIWTPALYNTFYRYNVASQTLETIGANLPHPSSVSQIWCDKDTDRLYVLYSLDGLFYSDDNGGTWTEIMLPTRLYGSCKIMAKNGVLAFFASGNALTPDENGVWLKGENQEVWSFISNEFRDYTTEASAIALVLEGSGQGSFVHTHFQETNEDDLTYQSAELNKFLTQSDDPLSKIVADAPGA